MAEIIRRMSPKEIERMLAKRERDEACKAERARRREEWLRRCADQNQLAAERMDHGIVR